MWLYQGNELTDIPEGKIGFVYLITNKSNNRKYVGKKQFYSFTSSMKTVTLKNGTKKKKRVKKKSESDWKTYFSSSDDLKLEIEQLGEDNYIREILHLCGNLGTMSYLEAREQIDRRVLESDEYLNRQIQCRVHQLHVKL